MILNIKPVQIERFMEVPPSCFDDIIASVCNYFGIDYQLRFMMSWTFKYVSKSEKANLTFEERLQYPYSCENELLAQYSGLTIEHFKLNNNDIFIENLTNQLKKGNPVYVHFNAYYCPWDPMFGKLHNNHVCLAIGLNDMDSILICDPWNLKECETVSLNSFVKQCKFYGNFTINSNINNVDNSKIDKILYDGMTQILLLNNTHTIFDSICIFANEFLTDFNPKEVNNYDGNYTNKLRGIQYNRNKFLIFLKYIKNKYDFNIDISILDEYQRIIHSWQIVVSLIIKSYFLKEISSLKKNIAKKIVEISNKEKELYYKIINREQYSYTHTLQNLNQPYTSIDLKKNIIKLEKYFNNKAFDYQYENMYNANFSGCNDFYILGNINRHEILRINNISFDFYNNLYNELDNITCLGQSIKMNTRGNKISIIGSCDFGSFTDTLYIQYSNGITEPIKISFSDFAMDPIFDEKIVWYGKAYYRDIDENKVCHENAYIYMKSYQLVYTDEILNIILPNCPCMHIFAITLTTDNW
jgi:hypothetical protein